MATKISSFSQGLGTDPTTGAYFTAAYGHDFECPLRDDEEKLYRKGSSSTTSVTWRSSASGFRETVPYRLGRATIAQWVAIRCTVSSHRLTRIWVCPHFGQGPSPPSPGGRTSPRLNIAYSGLYHWWYTMVGMTTRPRLYQGSIFIMMILSAFGRFFAVASTFSQVLAFLWPGFKNADTSA